MPHHCACIEADLPTCFQQPPADINVIAGATEPGIEAACRDQPIGIFGPPTAA
jgi:hypothetical protein